MSRARLRQNAARARRSALARATGMVGAAAVRTQGGPARQLWRSVYELLARGVGWLLTREDADASVYVAAGVAAGDPVYGLSDIDLVLVTGCRDRARRRWERLRAAVPPLGDLFADLAIYTPAELGRASRASTLTVADGPTYLGPHWPRDERGLRERPGIRGATADWRRLTGPRSLPAIPKTTPEQLRIAAWLELQFWWRQAMRFAADPGNRHARYMCVKLAAHAARVWLAVEHGEYPRSHRETLAAAARRLPEERASLTALDAVAGDLGRPGGAPWGLALPALVRFSGRVAAKLGRDAAVAGSVEVRLTGAPQAPPFPLLDWRGLVLPALVDDGLEPCPGDPADRATLARATAAHEHGYGGLRSGPLLVLATGEPWTRSFLRAASCRTTGPVVFALLDGAEHATFPRLAGFTIEDVARRAVEEHAAWLRHTADDGVLEDRAWLDGRLAGAPASLRVAAKLVTAARAAILHESLLEQRPELAVTVAAVGQSFAERYPSSRSAVEEVAGAYEAAEPPVQSALRELRQTLLRASPTYNAGVTLQPA